MALVVTTLRKLNAVCGGGDITMEIGAEDTGGITDLGITTVRDPESRSISTTVAHVTTGITTTDITTTTATIINRTTTVITITTTDNSPLVCIDQFKYPVGQHKPSSGVVALSKSICAYLDSA